jgi:hypothetical protein
MPPTAKNHGEHCTMKRYYFDHRIKKCRGFNYRGRRGNLNNFETIQLCEEACKK